MTITQPQRIDNRDIPWRDIRGLALRVVNYIPLAERADGTDLLGRAHVKDFSGRLPYAVVEVESIDPKPKIWQSQTALFPVRHRDDFRAVDHAMELVTDELEVWIGYRPIKFPWYVPLKRSMPNMVVYVAPTDQSERDGESPIDLLRRMAPIWVYEPLVSRFGGRWSYDE